MLTDNVSPVQRFAGIGPALAFPGQRNFCGVSSYDDGDYVSIGGGRSPTNPIPATYHAEVAVDFRLRGCRGAGAAKLNGARGPHRFRQRHQH